MTSTPTAPRTSHGPVLLDFRSDVEEVGLLEALRQWEGTEIDSDEPWSTCENILSLGETPADRDFAVLVLSRLYRLAGLRASRD